MFSNDEMMGGGSSWLWFIIVIFALFGGLGGNGLFGNGSAQNYTLASDFATLQRQIDTAADQLQRQTTAVADGLCSGFYQEAQLVNGVNANLANGFATAELARANNQAALMAQLYNMQSANQQCCCENRYDALVNSNNIQNALSSGFCTTNYNNANNTRDIIDSQRADTQAILAKLSCMESNAKDEKIADLTARNQALQFAASQQAQNAYLVSRLQPTPVPSYPAGNLYGYYGTTIS